MWVLDTIVALETVLKLSVRTVSYKKALEVTAVLDLLLEDKMVLFSGCTQILWYLPNCFAWKLRFQQEDRLLSPEKRNQIESKVQDLAQKLGINKPITIMEKKCSSIAEAQGVAWFSGRAGIIIDPGVANAIPEEQLEFLIAHELSHIKNNDNVSFGVVPGIVTILTHLAIKVLFPSLKAFIIPSPVEIFVPATIQLPRRNLASIIADLVSVTFSIFFYRWREKSADKLGFSICSDAGQKAAPQFFDLIKRGNIWHRNSEEASLFTKMFITEDGENMIDIGHPWLKDRIKYLQSGSSL
jgi:Zn-dependent protease with chaperone function